MKLAKSSRVTSYNKLNAPIISSFFQVPSVLSRLINMASTGQKRKADFAFPDYVVKSLECPVCLETIKDPPVFQCEKGHALCQTCRAPLKAQGKPCPVCRGKLVDTRNLAVENMLEQLPKAGLEIRYFEKNSKKTRNLLKV